MHALNSQEYSFVAGGTREEAENIGEAMAGAGAVAAMIPGGQGVAALLFIGAAGWEIGAAI